MHTTIIRLLWTVGALVLLLALGAALGTAGAAPSATVPGSALPTQLPLVGCRNCVSFGIGNATPVAVHNADPLNQCHNCVLTTSGINNFWASIQGPGSRYDNGDAYNTKYLSPGGYNGTCPGQIDIGPLNPNYIAGPNSLTGGYNYGLRVEYGNPQRLTVYVYDPAQYYRPLNQGYTDPDTLDSQPCYSGAGSDPTRYRYRTYYTVYAPDETPDDFSDDVQIFQTSFVDTNDPALHDRWFPLTTLNPYLLGYLTGDFRLQVTTDDQLANGQYGAGNNQYSLALGGSRTPQNAETIYNLDHSSRLNNIRAVSGSGAVDYDIARVPGEYAGGQMIIRLFDPGDFSCNTRMLLINPNGQPAIFKQDGITDTTYIDTTTCSPGCVRPYNGTWTSMWVDLPADYQGVWWQLRYEVGSCRTNAGTVDATVWDVQVTRPAATVTPTATDTPSPTDTVTATATHTATSTPSATPTPSGTPTATATHTATSTPSATPTPTRTDTATVPPSATRTVTPTPATTNTPSPTASPTLSPSHTVTPQSSATRTLTALPPTATATGTPGGCPGGRDATNNGYADVYRYTAPPCGSVTPAPSGTPTLVITPLPPTATRTGTTGPTLTPTRTATTGPTLTSTGTPLPVATGTPPGTTASPSPTLPSATSTPCLLPFTDVDPSNPFYPFVRCLACRGIISGYGDGTFRPYALVTRGQASKMIALAATLGAPVPSDQQTFEDMPSGNPFWAFVEQLAGRGYISGYACGGAGEPCQPPGNRPYFRPYANITRSQIAKVVANTAGYSDVIASDQQTFADVPPGHPFWIYIERVNLHGVVSGYGCGGAGEPCQPPTNRPYFRPTNSATRGQTAKIVANTFYPGCQTQR